MNARYAGSNGQKYTASTGVKKNRLTSYTSLTYRTKDTYEIGDEVGKTTVTEGSDGSSAEKQADAGSTTVYGYNIWDFLQKIGYTCNEKLNADLKGSFYRNKRDKRVGKMYQDIFLDYTLNGKVTYLPGEKQQLVIGYIYDNYRRTRTISYPERKLRITVISSRHRVSIIPEHSASILSVLGSKVTLST